MRWAFEQLAEGIFSGEHILKAVIAKGIPCSKNNFYTIMRNPVYCGKIVVPKYKDEEMRLVQGLHKPLISEALFFRVQDILDARKRQYGFPIATPEDPALFLFLHPKRETLH
jgi:hypothetical protein